MNEKIQRSMERINKLSEQICEKEAEVSVLTHQKNLENTRLLALVMKDCEEPEEETVATTKDESLVLEDCPIAEAAEEEDPVCPRGIDHILEYSPSREDWLCNNCDEWIKDIIQLHFLWHSRCRASRQ